MIVIDVKLPITIELERVVGRCAWRLSCVGVDLRFIALDQMVKDCCDAQKSLCAPSSGVSIVAALQHDGVPISRGQFRFGRFVESGRLRR